MRSIENQQPLGQTMVLPEKIWRTWQHRKQQIFPRGGGGTTTRHLGSAQSLAWQGYYLVRGQRISSVLCNPRRQQAARVRDSNTSGASILGAPRGQGLDRMDRFKVQPIRWPEQIRPSGPHGPGCMAGNSGNQANRRGMRTAVPMTHSRSSGVTLGSARDSFNIGKR